MDTTSPTPAASSTGPRYKGGFYRAAPLHARFRFLKNVQRFRCLFERLEKPASARIPHVFDGRRRPRGMKCVTNVRDSAGSEEKEQPVPLMPVTLECRVGVGGGQRGGRTPEPGIPGNAPSPWARAPAASNPSTAGHLSNRPVNYPRPQGTG